MENIEITLNQRQANLMLRALEVLDIELLGLWKRGDREEDGSREVAKQLWNEIMDAGLGAGFGSVDES